MRQYSETEAYEMGADSGYHKTAHYPPKIICDQNLAYAWWKGYQRAEDFLNNDIQEYF